MLLISIQPKRWPARCPYNPPMSDRSDQSPGQPFILYSPPPAPDVLAIAHQHLPPGLQFEVVAAGEVPATLPEADYLMGFIGRLSDEALAGARRLKLVQLMSVGYDTF